MFAFYLLNYLIMGNFARGHLPIKQPAFRSLPVTIRSEENETIFLPCIVDDLGDSSVRWWKEEVLLADTGNFLMAIPPNYTIMRDGLTIKGLNRENAGEYTCEIMRPRPWSPLKQTHIVQVLYPPVITMIPVNGEIVVKLGEQVRMGCSATGVPAPVIFWRTRNLNIPTNSSVLEFVAVDRHMSGTYQCEANNGIGDPVHSNINLKILHEPKISIEKPWVHSAPGIKTALVCHIVASPEAHVEWFFNGDKLTISARRLTYQVWGNDHFLQFAAVAASDFGNYTCSARNSLGLSQGQLQLSGVANPVVIKKTESKPPTDFSIIWEVDSYSPIFEYKLLFRKINSKNNQWISFIIPADSFPSGPLHSKSYTFSGLDKFTLYEAKIFSRNRFGWSNSSEVITFGSTKPKLKEEKENSLQVSSNSESTVISRFKLKFELSLTLSALTLFQNICGIS